MSWIDDSALGCIIKYYPCLRCFDLGTQFFWQTRPKIGLVALLSSMLQMRSRQVRFATQISPTFVLDALRSNNHGKLRSGFRRYCHVRERSKSSSGYLASRPKYTTIQVE
ncbi:hypothetical protein BDR03DRAFT_944661 [Suillus americanus]|nr:hypothetical protein BDR03DRAFT_944661 [Suillus americanus]